MSPATRPRSRPRRIAVWRELGLVSAGAGVPAVALAVHAGVWPWALGLGLVALAAAALEVHAVRGGARRRPLGCWIAPALGLVAFAVVAIAIGPRGPDFGLAVSVAVAGVAISCFALAVVANTVAALTLKLRG